MSDSLSGPTPSPDAAREAAVAIVHELRTRGHRAFFAGGCVRDELIGREPDDYDVATDATPDRISSLFDRTSQVGASFGVVLVKLGRGRHAAVVEVATFRSDGDYSDRRRPDRVHFSDPGADAQRRDFTVNALFLDPLHEPESPAHATLPGSPTLVASAGGGTIVDYVGGISDLRAGVLRAVGDPDARLAEDHLRALRAVRLGAKLGFAIAPETASAIRRHAADLRGVSRERIGDEVRLMMSLPGRAEAARMLTDLSLDAAIFEDRAGGGAPERGSPTVLSEVAAHAGLGACLGAWAIDRGLGPIESFSAEDRSSWCGKASRGVQEVCTRWRGALCLSNDERDAMSSTLHWAGLIVARWESMSVAHRKRTAGAGAFPAAMDLIRAWESAGNRAGRTAASGNTSRVDREVEALATTWGGIAPEPIVTGDHLTGAGHAPGPGYRLLLERVYDAQLEGRVRTLAEGLELAARVRVSDGQ